MVASSGQAGGGVERAASRRWRRRAVERVAASWSGGGGVERTNALVERESWMNGVQRVVWSRRSKCREESVVSMGGDIRRLDH